MNKLYIVDAVNYLFRSYYAIGPMTNASGASTSALYGFIRGLQKLIKTVQPEHLVCVFDGPENKKSRQNIYAEYKSHRKECPQDLIPQIESAYEYCSLAGIPILCVNGVEADDVMATIAVWAEKQGVTSYMCTTDKDLAQLVSDHIFLLHPHKDYMLIDTGKVVEIYGVRPDQILDYLSIMGDASDNIPGIPGFGPKTAAALLAEFGTLENILQNPEKVKGEKKQQVIRESKEIALMSKALATLDTNVEIPHDPSFYKLKTPDIHKLSDFCHRMQFSSLLREIDGNKQETPLEQNHYHLVDSPEKIQSLFYRLSKEKEVGIDTETTDIRPLIAELVGVGFAVSPHEAWYVPCYGKPEIQELLQQFFAKSDSFFYGHNIKYDLHVLANHDIFLQHIGFDTMLASYLLEPQVRRHNLDDLTLEKFKKVKIPIETLIGKGKTQISMKEVPIEQVQEYCCEDIDYTVRLKLLFEKELKQRNLEKVFRNIELPLLPILANMERTGIYLDIERLQEIGKTLLIEQQAVEKKIYEQVGFTFNLNSPKQLSDILFITLKIKKPSNAKTAFATGADVLEELAGENPIANDILVYRGLEKLRTTYVDALPGSVNPKTGRIHCTFNQSVAATGRLSRKIPISKIFRQEQNRETRSGPVLSPKKKGGAMWVETTRKLNFAYSPILVKIQSSSKPFEKKKIFMNIQHQGFSICRLR